MSGQAGSRFPKEDAIVLAESRRSRQRGVERHFWVVSKHDGKGDACFFS